MNQCTKFSCLNAQLVRLLTGESIQTDNGFLIAKVTGWYCPKCAGSYGDYCPTCVGKVRKISRHVRRVR